MPAECVALNARYQSALRRAKRRGALRAVEAFEVAAQGSKAVMARPYRELDRLASSNKELFSTYYNLVRSEVRLPHGNEWDELRAVADEELFPGYREHIQFAALCLDGAGLPYYGDCSFVFRESMIAHRASVYEENWAAFLKKRALKKIAKPTYQPPPGHRATWIERAKLAVAKHGSEIAAAATPEQFVGILLGPGATPEEDRFIEVHIWGPMSIRTVETVLLTPPRKGRRSAHKAIGDRLRKLGVNLGNLQ